MYIIAFNLNSKEHCYVLENSNKEQFTTQHNRIIIQMKKISNVWRIFSLCHLHKRAEEYSCKNQVKLSYWEKEREDERFLTFGLMQHIFHWMRGTIRGFVFFPLRLGGATDHPKLFCTDFFSIPNAFSVYNFP